MTVLSTNTIRNLSGLGDGTVMGQSSADLISFYGGSPIARQSAPTAAGTTASTSTTPWGFATSTQADAFITEMAAIRTILVNLNLCA